MLLLHVPLKILRRKKLPAELARSPWVLLPPDMVISERRTGVAFETARLSTFPTASKRFVSKMCSCMADGSILSGGDMFATDSVFLDYATSHVTVKEGFKPALWSPFPRLESGGLVCANSWFVLVVSTPQLTQNV